LSSWKTNPGIVKHPQASGKKTWPLGAEGGEATAATTESAARRRSGERGREKMSGGGEILKYSLARSKNNSRKKKRENLFGKETLLCGKEKKGMPGH